MLGGGTWAQQNKVLPGTYINVSSAAAASSSLSKRGYVAMPLTLDWGPENEIFTVKRDDFIKNCRKIFGYSYSDAAMLPLRELFQYAQVVYAYRLNGGGTKAANTYGTAKYAGSVGNKLSIVVSVNVDDATKFDVSTYYDSTLIETQTVAGAAELRDNDYIDFKHTAELEETAKLPLTGGANGEVKVDGYQAFLDKAESFSYNVLGCPTADATVIGLFINFTERMRDKVGAKFQTVIYNPYGGVKKADHEGIIEVGVKAPAESVGLHGLVYWVAGVAATCAVNASNTNRVYNGELEIAADYTQAELENSILGGWFMLHKVGDEIRVLEDINSLTTLTDEKGALFQSNQTVRVIDQIANDVAALFNTRYLGVIPNDADGRVSLWNDIVKIHEELETIRAIKNFDSESVVISQGNSKKSVVCSISGINIINAMSQLYMNVIIE